MPSPVVDCALPGSAEAKHGRGTYVVVVISIFVTVVGMAALSMSCAIPSIYAHSQSRQLSDNPCDLFTVYDVTAITHLDVREVRRVPSITKIVEAQRSGRETGPGTICSYETDSDFGAIEVVVPIRSERDATHYWTNRERYFRTYPGAARPIPEIGIDAWLSGGNSLSVLTDQDEYFVISTQFYQRESAELLSHLARAVTRR
jgi:hypothetical protein